MPEPKYCKVLANAGIFDHTNDCRQVFIDW